MCVCGGGQTGGKQTGGKFTFVVDAADILLALDVPQSHGLVMRA